MQINKIDVGLAKRSKIIYGDANDNEKCFRKQNLALRKFLCERKRYSEHRRRDGMYCRNDRSVVNPLFIPARIINIYDVSCLATTESFNLEEIISGQSISCFPYSFPGADCDELERGKEFTERKWSWTIRSKNFPSRSLQEFEISAKVTFCWAS